MRDLRLQYHLLHFLHGLDKVHFVKDYSILLEQILLDSLIELLTNSSWLIFFNKDMNLYLSF
jgi:hypothetical protein